MTRVLVIHGPNLNLLGTREPSIYGTTTLDEINAALMARDDVAVECVQSNVEGEIVGYVQSARGSFDAILLNPGGYSHTSVAIRDAIDAAGVPTIEVHLSNIYAREDFRHQSYVAPVAVGQISGFGVDSYRLALYAAITLHQNSGDAS